MEELDIGAIIKKISEDKGVERDRIELAIKSAFIKTAREIINDRAKFEIDFSDNTATVYEVVPVVSDQKKFGEGIKLSEAKERFPDEDIKVGDELQIPHDLSKFGRKGSEALYAYIEKSIEETKGNSLYFKYKDLIGQKIKGRVIFIDKEENTILDIENRDIQAIIKRRDRIKGEILRIGSEISAAIKYVKIDKYDNKITLELSRTNLKFLQSLFAISVPELADGVISIEGSARIPGERAKVAVKSSNPKVDAISAMIGTKGARINSVSRELNGEIIDIIGYSAIPEIYIKNALSPATVGAIKIGETETAEGEKLETAYVMINRSERGKAIGKSGINLRLAKMLTGYEIRLLTIDDKQQPFSDVPKKEEKNLSADDVLGALFK